MKKLLVGLLALGSVGAYAETCNVSLRIEAKQHFHNGSLGGLGSKFSENLEKKAYEILESKGYRVTAPDFADSNIVINVDIRKQNIAKMLTSNTQPPEGVGYNRVMVTRRNKQSDNIIFGRVIDQGYSAGPSIQKKSLSRMSTLLEEMKDCK